jgi:hypothetical protein
VDDTKAIVYRIAYGHARNRLEKHIAPIGVGQDDDELDPPTHGRGHQGNGRRRGRCPGGDPPRRRGCGRGASAELVGQGSG